LKNGSSVLVRIISAKGGGKYEGSVAGVRVNISSARQLKVGETFVASINARDGTIYLNPKDSAAAAMTMSFSELGEGSLMAFLASSGLPADSISVSLLQMLKQMGLKLDSAFISKIRNLALRFSGKEKAAAELLSMIKEKGLEASEEEIKELLALLEREENESPDDKAGKKENKALIDEESLINRINQTPGAWYLLPFDLVQLDGERLGSGCIRLLFDSAKLLKLLNLEAKYKNHKYLFSLSYEGKKLSDLRFNVSGIEKPEEELRALKKRFMAADVPVGSFEWAEEAEIEGSASGLESFYAFGGQV